MLIELQNVTFRYNGSSRPVLDNVTITIPEGKSIAIIGPSGSGKSTLLNILGTLDFPTAGEVWLNGVVTGRMDPDALVKVRNNDIGFIFQTHLLLPQLTVFENILLPVLPRGKDAGEAAKGRLPVY
jgi:lipoprotein-releasing system ATP-binding protein